MCTRFDPSFFSHLSLRHSTLGRNEDRPTSLQVSDFRNEASKTSRLFDIVTDQESFSLSWPTKLDGSREHEVPSQLRLSVDGYSEVG